MRGVVVAVALGAVGAAVACGNSDSAPSAMPPSVGSASGTGTGMPPAPVGCPRSLESGCNFTDVHVYPMMCVPDWATAQAPSSGCRRVSTQSCAGFDIAYMPDGSKLFFDPRTGLLIAGAEESPMGYLCQGGPDGFADPLVLACTPPTREVCAPDAAAGDAQAGDAVAAAADATDERATD